ncbi:MAG: hypothetical protein HY901_25510 [Deltaproteobacteria bacterium]|nr:hypothetical protein [Deltaproteobacteria bacterium]
MLSAMALAHSAAGCAHAPVLSAGEGFDTPAGRFQLSYEPADGQGAAMVRRAVVAAAPRLASRWGALPAPVEIQVVPTHGHLERAVGRGEMPWMRAWAQRSEVQVQSPSTWLEGGASQAQADELVLHELTHCLMYQLAAPETGWQTKGIPAWFREGMASVTADQAHRRGTLPDLKRAFCGAGQRSSKLLTGGAERRWEGEAAELVYAAAHHAFVFLLKRVGGDEAIRRLLSTMHVGLGFEEAFLAVAGVSREAFEEEFRAFLCSERWKGEAPLAGPP